jgi:hypothetical protein
MCLYTFCIYYTSNRLEICCVVHPMRNIRRKELGELEKFRVQQRNKLKEIVSDRKIKSNIVDEVSIFSLLKCQLSTKFEKPSCKIIKHKIENQSWFYSNFGNFS